MAAERDSLPAEPTEKQGVKERELSQDEASAKIAAAMKGNHVRKEIKRGNTDRLADPEHAAKVDKKKKGKGKPLKRELTQDEASAKIAAAMKGNHERKEIKARPHIVTSL